MSRNLGRLKLCLFYISMIVLIIIGEPNLSMVRAAPEESDRPKIGLALGGGGALGLAHIGVLKWMEENRIPVDYIAGTSMGGLIGGCYAMGMSPDDIGIFMSRIKWDRVFNPVPPYDAFDFRRKEDRRDYPIETEIGLREKHINIPNGLPIHEIGLLLSRLTLPYSTIKNFDELPIPYRCVAVDIRRSEEVVMGDGLLAEAMRATMAIPGVFTPVEWQGRLLVDGGILKNLPADVVKTMGADVTIAVDLFNFNQSREIKGLSSILLHTVDTVTIDNTRRSAKLANLVITPDPQGLTPTSWKAVEKFIENGYQAAAMQAERLRQYALDETAWQNYLYQRQMKRRLNLPQPEIIEVIGTSGLNQNVIKEKLSKYIGRPLNPELLEKDLTDILGSGLYEGLRYSYKVDDNGRTVLLITAVEKIYGPPLVDFAFLLDDDGVKAEHVDINARCRITSFNLAGPGSELRTDLGFGTELHLFSELYKPYFGSKWFVAPAVFLEQKNSSLFQDDVRINEYKVTDNGFQLDIGYSFNKFSEARLGCQVFEQSAHVSVGESLPGDSDGTIRMARLKWTYSSADGVMLDNKGLYWDLNLKKYEAGPEIPSNFSQAETKLVWTHPVRSRDAVFTLFAAGTSFNDTAPLLQQFLLGGPFRLGAYNFDQLRGSNYLLTNVGYLKFLNKLPLTGKDVYLGIWLEHGGVFENRSDFEPDTDLSMGLFSPTVFGPVYIGASYGKGDNPLFNIMVGKIF